MASACGSILKRIFPVFASSARLTLLHMPSGIAFSELADGTDLDSDGVQRSGDRQ